MRRDVVFVHVPKTGGTSVRVALDSALASNHMVLRDYEKDPQTTPELYQLTHVAKEPEKLREKFGGSAKGIFLSGHFPASRYWDCFNAESFVVFMRDPVDRVFSEYGSWVKRGRWTGTFEEFLDLPAMCRRFERFFSGVDIDDLGFIGFMVEFEASIAALSRYIGADLPIQKLNPGNYAALDQKVLTESKYREMVLERSLEDIALYKAVRAKRGGLFVARGAGRDIADHYMGNVVEKGGIATGWLCNTAREFITEVEVLRNRVQLATAKADRYREGVMARGMSRSGVCGFKVDLREFGSGEFIFRARGTQFELPGSPLRL